MTRHSYVTLGIFLGLLLGVASGEALRGWGDPAAMPGRLETLAFLGDTLFIRLLRMVMIPLVVSSGIVGVASIGDPRKLGSVGGWTMSYYFTTMFAAVLLGLLLVGSFAPGNDFPEGFRRSQVESFTTSGGALQQRVEGAAGTGLLGAMKNILLQLLPVNPIASAVQGDVLPTISFSLILGAALSLVGEKGRVVVAFFDGVFAAMMKLVEWILLLGPVGVFCLVAHTVAKIGFVELVGPLGGYMLVVIAGLLLHALVTLPLVLWVFGRAQPYRFLWRVKDALLTAFACSSSNATIPVTVESCIVRGGCSRRATEFVVPLGATINMDGTALYEAVAVVFLFQCFGVELSLTQLGIVAVTATLAAVGAAGIPSAGLVTMVIVVEAVNHSLGEASLRLPLSAVGIVLGVDRILDMCRTTVNVWGDAVGAKIITRIAADE